MTYKDYDLEGLYFSTYKNVIHHNSFLNGSGLDKSQLREVTTSIFIAKTHKGIVRPESDENDTFEIPDDYKHLVDQLPKTKTYDEIATQGQIDTINKLLKDTRITEKECNRIESILAEPEISKSTASDILSYFYGETRKQNGNWVKVSDGVLKKRKAHHHQN